MSVFAPACNFGTPQARKPLPKVILRCIVTPWGLMTVVTAKLSQVMASGDGRTATRTMEGYAYRYSVQLR